MSDFYVCENETPLNPETETPPDEEDIMSFGEIIAFYFICIIFVGIIGFLILYIYNAKGPGANANPNRYKSVMFFSIIISIIGIILFVSITYL